MKIFIKVLGLAILFAILLNFANASLFGGNTYKKEEKHTKQENTNIYKFKRANQVFLSKVGVALTTNIGTKYTQREKINLYKKIPYVVETISNKKYVDNKNLSQNLLKIQEYYNILNTDIRQMINKAYDKRATLNAYIDQLKYRYKDANFRVNILNNKKSEFSTQMAESSKKISLLKKKISYDFSKFNNIQLENDIEKLLKQKKEYNYSRTYLIFTNKYISQYQKLNDSNKKLINVLERNKEAILKNTKVVIPKTGVNLLKKLDLIVDEKK